MEASLDIVIKYLILNLMSSATYLPSTSLVSAPEIVFIGSGPG